MKVNHAQDAIEFLNPIVERLYKGKVGEVELAMAVGFCMAKFKKITKEQDE